MFRWFNNLFTDKTFGAARSPKWGKVRKDFLREHPECAVCGKKSTLLNGNEIHHIIPFWIDPIKELLKENFLTLCREHHFLFGHFLSWASFNKDVVKDSAEWRVKIKTRQ